MVRISSEAVRRAVWALPASHSSFGSQEVVHLLDQGDRSARSVVHDRSQSCNRNAPLLEESVQLGAVVDGVHDDVFEIVAGEGLRDQGAAGAVSAGVLHSRRDLG